MSQPVPGWPTHDGPTLVGREHERARLQSLLTTARAGGAALVMLDGEAGIGKTTLVEALAAEAAGLGVLVLTGQCDDLDSAKPYGPWVSLRASPPVAPSSPLLVSLESSHGTSRTQAELFAHIWSEVSSLAAAQSVLLVLEDLHWADEASLELLYFVGRSIRRGRTQLPLLVVATYRDADVPRHHGLQRLLPALVRDAHTERISLPPFDAQAIRALIRTRHTLSDEDEARLVDYLLHHSQGNPLYASELLRSLDAERVLWFGPGGWQLAELHHLSIPGLIRQVIDQRLVRLRPATQAALERAAIIGQDIAVNVWSDLSGLDEDAFADVVAEAIVWHVLEETPDRTGLRFTHALIREVLYDRVVLPRRRVWHRRLAETLVTVAGTSASTIAAHFQRAGDERAIEWHVRAGLQARPTDWIGAAHHFETAAQLLAARNAAPYERRWLAFEAGFLLRFAGREHAVALFEAAEVAARVNGDPVLEAYAHYLRGSQRCMLGDLRRGLPEVRGGIEAIDRLLATCPVLNTETQALAVIGRLVPDETVEAAGPSTAHPPDGRDVPRVNHQRGVLINWLALAGRYAEAIAMGERYLHEEVAALADPQLRRAAGLMCQLGLGHAYAGVGRVAEARELLAQAYAAGIGLGDYAIAQRALWAEVMMTILPYAADQIAEREQRVALAAEAWERSHGLTIASAGAGAPSELLLQVVTGQWERARQLATQQLTVPWCVVVHEAIITLGILDRHQGDPLAAWERVLQLLPDGPLTEPGERYFPSALTAVALAADLALDARDFGTAQRWIETHERWLDWSEACLWRPTTQLLRARYHALTGDLVQAMSSVDAARTLASEPRQPLTLAAAERALGRLARMTGEFDRAARYLEVSLDLATACRAPFERALTLVEVAEVQIARGDASTAPLILDEARTICAPLGANPTLKHVDALAAADAADEPASAARPDGLTAREGEVLRLIAAGYSNRQIAEALFLSPRTVERHIANLYLKLDVHSKVEALAYAHRYGLT